MMAQREAEAPGGGEALSRRDFLKAAWLLALGSAGAAAGFFSGYRGVRV